MPVSGFPVGNQFPTAGFVGKAALHAAIDVKLDALYNALYAGYSSFTPAITSTGTAPNLGTGFTSVGEYKIIGDNVCVFSAAVTWGTTPGVGTGTYRFTVPVARVGTTAPMLLTAQLTEGGVNDHFDCNWIDTTHIAFTRGDHTANQLSATYPTAPVAGWVLYYGGYYRCGT